MGIRTQRTRLLIAVAVALLGCTSPFKSFTYDPDLQSVPLPPGVNSNPDQFRGQVDARGAPQPSHDHLRLGKCTPACLVHVTIAPVGDTREVNPTGASPAGPSSGRPVAKIMNLDPTNIEDMYGLRPSTQFEYYVWADTTGTGTRARMTLLEVPAVGQPGLVHAFFQKNLRICVHGPHYPAGSDADFRWCEGLSTSTGSGVSQAAMFPLPPLAALLSRVSAIVAGTTSTTQPPIWLRCTDGCCS